MSYEFEPIEGGNALPRVPSFFGAVGRIANMLPNDPVFVGYASVIRDPDTEDIGIDRHDVVPPQAQIDHAKTLPIGVMRIFDLATSIEGYIVDLRYSVAIQNRVLGFSGDDIPEAMIKERENHDTVPVLGAIFQGIGTGNLYFTYQKGMDLMLRPHAAILTEWVDAERLKQGIVPAATEFEATPTEIRAKEYLRETQ